MPINLRQHAPVEPTAMAPGLLYDDAASPAGYCSYSAVGQDGALVYRVIILKSQATPERLARAQAEAWDVVFPAEPLRLVRG